MGCNLSALPTSKPLSTKALRALKSLPYHGIQRVSVEDLDVHAFRSKFEAMSTPALIDGCCSDWAAMDWTEASLKAQFGELNFQMSWSTGAQQMTLKDYFEYMKDTARFHSCPLYLFEDLSSVIKSDPKGAILQQYDPPDYFGKQYDLFELGYLQKEDCLSNRNAHRPPFRWLLIGPAGSGSMLHVDPDETSAWNALLRGVKHWVLLPPNTEHRLLPSNGAAPAMGQASGGITNIGDWYRKVLPCLRTSLRDRVIEFTQQRGQVVFVPAGWSHAVLNCEPAIAVTQNFCSLCNVDLHSFDAICHEVFRVESLFAHQWLSDLRSAAPALGTRADSIRREREHRNSDTEGVGVR